MGNTRIEWTDKTFNAWWGCIPVSPGCDHCYADTLARRWGHDVFQHRGPRRMLSDDYWRQPLAWNREAQRTGVPIRVFTMSMGDLFEDHPQVTEARERLWPLIDQTPWLRWQLLTKRPRNVTGMVPWGNAWPDHVWLGTSAEDQHWANIRIPALLQIPAAVRFLSCEPLLGPIDLKQAVIPMGSQRGHGLTASYVHAGDCCTRRLHGIDWVIAGGESGPNARPMHPRWATGLRDQCRAAGVAFFFKQWGAYAPETHHHDRGRITVIDLQGHTWNAADPSAPPDAIRMRRVGKGKAGRCLSGRLHEATPPLPLTRTTKAPVT